MKLTECYSIPILNDSNLPPIYDIESSASDDDYISDGELIDNSSIPDDTHVPHAQLHPQNVDREEGQDEHNTPEQRNTRGRYSHDPDYIPRDLTDSPIQPVQREIRARKKPQRLGY